MEKTLEHAEISEAIKTLPGWVFSDNRLRAEFRFRNFVEAFGFMASAALEAEKMDHHPDWSNSYNKVAVELTTHSAGGVTEKDIVLARKLQQLAAARR
ncbi:MAG: 4a-hydroxytetrahydrobiopterin dehydratase [Verrucomicrobia bacterium]|nr:4a-hydroxytetrahydrobiopterin dehydratase [Verrucomicrobiota bacterium]